MASKLLSGILVLGAAFVVTAAVVAGPRLFVAARPLLRTGLKKGLEAYAKVRSSVGELAEDVEDLYAEVKSEFSEKSAPKAERPPASTNVN